MNKVATAAQLRFDVQNSPSLPEEVRQRLVRLAGKRMTSEGILVIEAKRYRTQEQNRQDAHARLVELLRKAAQPPKTRHKTQVPLEAKRRRLGAKRRRSEQKRLRGRAPLE
jgi:ribosome-associated protein